LRPSSNFGGSGGVPSVARKAAPEDGVKAIERRLRAAKDRRCEPLRQGAKRALDAIKDQRQPTIPVEKTDKRRRKTKGGAKKGQSKSALAQALDRSMVNQLVSPEAQAKGDYRPVDFKLQEVTEGGKRVEKTIRVVRNMGGSPIERWHRSGAFDERQVAAILFYQQAWHMHIGEPRTVANWSAVIVRAAVGAIEIYAGSRLAAKESLRLLDQEVFFREPVDHFHVWQNVVIWDEPAGVAGSRVGFLSTKQSEAAARLIVGSMAHKIADIVIDQSRRDFGDLLLDLDAPRRPG
jgi:hypothetical protein